MVVDSEVCTGCMLCVAACPADGFLDSDASFLAVLAGLQTVDGFPVLGCSMEPESNAHERLSCLGMLAEEHLAALAVFLPKGIQLNAGRCGDCVNAFILAELKDRITRTNSLLPGEHTDRLILVEKTEQLSFREPSLDRRAFFRDVGRDLATAAASLILSESERPALPRVKKQIPLKRKLASDVAQLLPVLARERFLAEFHHELRFEDTCTLCPRCAAVCPTGALERKPEGCSWQMVFNGPLCTGCGLCADFCPHEAVSLVNTLHDGGIGFGQSACDGIPPGLREDSDVDPGENMAP